MTTTEYVFLHRAPTADEYRALCTAVGWQDVIDFDVAPESLARSLHHVVVERDGEAVGMGRLVGDGVMYFYIQDVAVRPEHQGRELGAAILERLLAFVRDGAPDRAFVGLFAAAGTEDFYRRHGFEVHEGLVGMFQVTPLERPAEPD